ncbi:MAG: hypothetical protein M3409_08545 [Gemmatimonadota bacterium]|nr:hypothetical protein [Gemmatimonadota bacterium]
MADIEVTREGRGRDVLVEQTGFRLSWGAIFAGLVVATVLQIALSLLGIGLGFLGWNPGDPVADLGRGAAIWAAITAIVTLFIAGMTTGRLAGVLTRGDGALHGVVMWGLSTLLAVWLISSGVSTLLGTAFGVVSRTAAATAGAAVSTVGTIGAAAVGQAGQLDLGTIQREVETTLQQTGDPALQPEAIEGQVQDVRGTATTGASNEALARDIQAEVARTAGRVDREAMINVITARSGMSRPEAEQLATRVENLSANIQTQVSATVDTLGVRTQQVAEDAQEALSRAAWLALLVMGLSVAAAAGGAAMTARE